MKVSQVSIIPPNRLLRASEVFEWDTSDHSHGWDLWLKGVLADGGRRCRLQCEKENEPLIEGMLVGTKKDELNVEEGEAVRFRG